MRKHIFIVFRNKGKNIEDDTDDLDKALAILEQKINYVGEEINTIKNQKE